MTYAAKGVPEGSSAVIPRLFCRDPGAEIDFCTQVFGAAELVRRAGPDGTLVHALVTIGAAMMMIESEWPGLANRPPAQDGSSPVALYVYVDDVDAIVERAVAGAATVLMPPTDQFWGDRTAWLLDPQGHVWTVAARIEEPSEDERRRRLKDINERAACQPHTGSDTDANHTLFVL
jgi:PhnB protein